MGATVELPLWLVVIAGLLALAGLIDRLLVPGLRWVVRERANRAIDEVNQRLHLRIQPFKLTKRESLIDRLVFDQEVIRAADAHATEAGEPRAVTLDRVKTYASEIVPQFNAYAYFRLGTRAARWLARLLYRVRLGYSDNKGLAQIDRDATVVFVMNHRSNMDYVLVTYMAAQSSALSYAVGEWARVWPLQSLIKAMGAYFIRRDSRDPLYRRVLARYVQIATEEGVTQAIFPEGGLTRDGALRPPKLGLLGYMVGRFDPEAERDVVFVPVGLNYDRVLEDRTLTAAQAREAGQGGQRQGIAAAGRYFLKALGLSLVRRWDKNGYACVSFGSPLSLREWCQNRGVSLKRLSEDERFAVIETLGVDLMRRIGRVIPALPVPLLATVFLKHPEERLDAMEWKARVARLMYELESTGVPVKIMRRDRDAAVGDALDGLVRRGLVLESEGLTWLNPAETVVMSYYARSIEHHVGALASPDKVEANPAPV